MFECPFDCGPFISLGHGQMLPRWPISPLPFAPSAHHHSRPQPPCARPPNAKSAELAQRPSFPETKVSDMPSCVEAPPFFGLSGSTNPSNRARPALWMGRGGWPSGRILVHFRAFEPKPRCRGTRATFGLHAVLATCPVFAFGARNPLFLGLKLAVGISVALQFGPFCHQLLHADGGDVRSRGAQFRSGSPMGCMWRLMSARGGSRGSCCRVLACFPD